MINTVHVLTIVVLILLLSIFCLETASADITIDGNTIHVETDNYKVQFEYGAITYLHNKLTGETYTLPLEPIYEIQAAILGRNKNFRARRAQNVETHKIDANTVETRFREGGNEIRLVIAIEPNTDDLLISGDGVSDTPGVSAIQWAIDNLNFSNLRLIVPSQKLQVIDTISVVKRRPFLYPSPSWQAQLAIVESEGGGFYIRSKDTTFKFKELFYWRFPDKFGLNIKTQNQAPWDTLTTATSVTWRLNTYAGDWCVPAQMYRDWMEQTFDPWRLSDRPLWVKDIGLVVLHSRLNADLLPNLAEVVDPTKTLLYLTDWREGGRNINYPDYSNPDERFENFLAVARQHGFRIMLHVNIHDCSPSHPLYPEFKKYQYRLPETGELSGWMWDEIDSPERNAHISLASSRWRNLLIQQWKAIWEKYNIDAFNLDVNHYVLNDANGLIEGLTSAEGNVLMHRQLAQAMPGVVFSGEFIHEVTFFRESFTKRTFTVKGPVHPISAFLFSPYTRFHGGGDLPGARDPRYHIYLDTVEGQGYVPSLWINKTEMLEIPLLQQVLAVARQWQVLGLTPDVGCDWGPNTLFRYATQTGETVTYQRTDSGSALVLPDHDGFERVYGVTQAQTHRSLRLWRAYNDTHLIGLNPKRTYFLDNAPRDFSQVRINSLPPDVYISETRVTDQAALFRLESTSSNRGATVGFSLPSPPVGSFPDTLRSTGSGQYTVEADLSQPVVIFLGPLEQVSLPYNLREAQFNAGFQLDDIDDIFRPGSLNGSGERTRTNIDNTRKDVINAIPPPDGQTVLQFSLLLPQEPSNFFFSVGLYEGCSDGVVCQVRLNGQTYFKTFKDTFDWTDGSIPLSPFAGQPLLLELVTDPGQEGSSSCDWAFWADLHITAAPNPDANLDGRINVLDLILVASSFGEQPPSNPQADTNKDGVVNLLDLVFVAEHLSQNAAAPTQLDLIKSIPSTAKEVTAAQRALTGLEAIPNKSHGIRLAIELLRHYLSIANQRVEETKLLPNYPNPFNPDTWIPYQLSEESTVAVKIYDVSGHLVRTIEVGHKPMGYYLTRERAVYWDGRNKNGEPVSSGVYFYTLNANNYTETRRMVIVK